MEGEEGGERKEVRKYGMREEGEWEKDERITIDASMDIRAHGTEI